MTGGARSRAPLVQRTESAAGRAAPVGAVLLAAGESTRMGELKALLAWGGQSLVAYQAAQLLIAPIARLVVVLGSRAGEVEAQLPNDGRLVRVTNPDYRSGKVSSIVAGVRELPADQHVLVLGVDQPRPAALVAETVAHHLRAGSAITVAGCGGRRGHPVIFAPQLRGELLAISEETEGLRAVLAHHRAAVSLCDTRSPLALVNLNTPDDYAAALALGAESGRSGAL